MPANSSATTRCGDLQITADEQAMIAVPSGCRVTEEGESVGRSALRDHPDAIAVLLVPSPSDVIPTSREAGWHNEAHLLMSETWKELPARLAALSFQPSEQVAVIARPIEPVRNAFDSVSRSAGPTLWRWLIEITKHESRLRTLQPELGKIWLTSDETEARATDYRLPNLVISPPLKSSAWLFHELSLLRLVDVGGQVNSPADATAVLAGLWLLHGDGDRSHRYSQTIEDEGRRSGNFWHGIMHRQEPDYGNSKYWFRRVGSHPIFPELARRANRLFDAESSASAQSWRMKLGLPSRWDPLAFVDFCEVAAIQGSTPLADLARRLQFLEMQLLLRATFADSHK